MRPFPLSIPLLLVLYCFWQPALAQNQVSLQQAISLSLKNNTQLRLSDAKIKLAESRVQQIHEQELPFVKGSASYSHFSLITPFAIIPPGAEKPVFGIGKGGFDATMAGLTAGEEIFSGFRVKNSLLSSEYLLKAVQLDAEKDKSDLVFTVTAAYYNIYKIMKSAQVIDENIKVLDEKAREIGSFEKAGMALHNDVLRIQLQKSNLLLSKAEVENARSLAFYNFKLMTGLPEQGEISIDTSSLFQSNTASSMLDYQNQALSNRSELKSNEMKTKATEYEIKAINSAKYPSLGLGGGYNYINPSKDLIPGQNLFINAWNVGLNLSYNFSSLYTGKGRLDEARANIEQLKDLKALQTNQIKSEIFQNYNAWMLAQQKIAVSKSAIAQAEENYRSLESRYRNNVAPLTDLLDANNLLMQAKVNYVNAQADAQIAYYKLINSTGNPITK